MVKNIQRSSGQDMGLGGLGIVNSKSGDYILFSSVLECLRWPQCWFHKIEISAMYSYIPLDLNQLLNIWVDQVPSHTPVRACVKKAYTDAKAAFIDILTNQQSVALRDIWTSHSTESYLTLTCHFKTDTFDMRSQVLHTGDTACK